MVMPSDMIWNFTGDPDEMAWVTRAAIDQGLENSPSDVKLFGGATINGTQNAVYKAKADIINGSISLTNPDPNAPVFLSADDFWNWFAVDAVQDEFTWANDTNSQSDVDLWQIAGDFATYTTFFDCHNPLRPDAYATQHYQPYVFLFFGMRPYPGADLPCSDFICFCDSVVELFTHTSHLIFATHDANMFVGSVLLSSLRVTRVPTLPPPSGGGGFYMPIPTIPTDLPEPPVLACPLCPAGADGPPGPPGTDGTPGTPGIPQTLEGFAMLLDSGTDEELTAIDTALHVVSDFTPIDLQLIATTALDGTAGLNIAGPMLQGPVPVQLKPTITTVETDENQYTITETMPKVLALTVGLAAAAVSALILLDKTITTAQCQPGDPLSELVLHYPALFTGSLTDQILWQELFNKLDQLQRCCPPCENADWTTLCYFTVFGTQNSAGYIDAIKLEEVEIPDGIDVWNGDPSKKRYGQFNWIFADGSHGEPNSILYSPQIFRAPAGRTIGVSWIMNKGVSMSCQQRGTASPKGSPYGQE